MPGLSRCVGLHLRPALYIFFRLQRLAVGLAQRAESRIVAGEGEAQPLVATDVLGPAAEQLAVVINPRRDAPFRTVDPLEMWIFFLYLWIPEIIERFLCFNSLQIIYQLSLQLLYLFGMFS